MRVIGMLLGALSVAGCMQVDPATLTFQNLSDEARRDYREAMFETPFSEGPVSVVVTERGQLRTYTLGPCAQSVCGGTGRRGSLTRTPDYWVVSGAYSGRRFHLAPGGDGYLEIGGQFLPLAWD